MEAKVEAKKLVQELSDLVKRFTAGSISPDLAWSELVVLTKRLQQLSSMKNMDDSLRSYLEKANVFREKAAIQIMEKRKTEDGEAGGKNFYEDNYRKNLELIENELNELMSSVSKQSVDVSLETLQDITRNLQELSKNSQKNTDKSLEEKAKELNFYREVKLTKASF